jgi:hypothetical protein
MGDQSNPNADLDPAFFSILSSPDGSDDQLNVFRQLLDEVKGDAEDIKEANTKLTYIKNKQKTKKPLTIEELTNCLVFAKAFNQRTASRSNKQGPLAELQSSNQYEPSDQSRTLFGIDRFYAKRVHMGPGIQRKCCDAIVLEVDTSGKTFGRQCRRAPSEVQAREKSKQDLCKQHRCIDDQLRYKTLSSDIVLTNGVVPPTKQTEIQEMFYDVVNMLQSSGNDQNSIREIRKFISKHDERRQKVFVEQVRIGIGQITQCLLNRPGITEQTLDASDLSDADEKESLCDADE